MTEELYIASVAGVAALCGAIVGRIFAVEAPDRRTAVLAAAYCGAGAGLVSSVPFAFLLVLDAREMVGTGFGVAALVVPWKRSFPACCGALRAAPAEAFWRPRRGGLQAPRRPRGHAD
jgi:hypothetical protein